MGTDVGGVRDAEQELRRTQIAVLEQRSLRVLERLRTAEVLRVSVSHTVATAATEGDDFGGDSLQIGNASMRNPEPADAAVLGALAEKLGAGMPEDTRVEVHHLGLKNQRAWISWGLLRSRERLVLALDGSCPVGLPHSVAIFEHLGVPGAFLTAVSSAARAHHEATDARLREEVRALCVRRADGARSLALVEAIVDAERQRR